ncbi:MAG: hypothetical protein LQ340_004781 [Diploschistes diacapsis]|nr:MAG: hypothetical protein LQ340_004781 [Diploschistes diacapsis]
MSNKTLFVFLGLQVLFMVTAVDTLVFLSTITMIKKREQLERYQLIDQKHGIGGI